MHILLYKFPDIFSCTVQLTRMMDNDDVARYYGLRKWTFVKYVWEQVARNLKFGSGMYHAFVTHIL